MAHPPSRQVDQLWVKADHYLNSFTIPQDDTLVSALKRADDNNLPQIAVSPSQGKLLNVLVKSIKAKRVLEVGTLAGYSTIWLARGIPADGKIITLELEQKHADVSRQNFEHAGVSGKIDIIVGSAVDSIKKLPTEEPFDFVFIDADKTNIPTYYKEARRLTRPGAVILVDNVVRAGRVADLEGEPSSDFVDGVRAFFALVKEDKGIEATTIQTIGEKGHDGFTYVVVL